MEFVKVENGSVVKFPYTFKDLRADYPNVSFPKDVNVALSAAADRGIYPVTPTPVPAFDPAVETVERGTPVEVNGEWQMVYNIVPLTQAQIDQNAADAAEAEDTAALKADAQVLALLKARPEQINNYIDANVTNLAEAKTVLKILARALAVVAQNTLK